MRPLFTKIFINYYSFMTSYGLYRGYNNLYCIDLYNTKKELITDRIKDSLVGGLYQMNPVLQPIFIYGISRLLEKYLRNKKITKNDFIY